MTLADQVAQCRTPFIVRHDMTGRLTSLNGTADWSATVAACPIRYVLRDELVGLCSELAYSKGARTIQCADLLHAPAKMFWIEWCNEPWHRALAQYGFALVDSGCHWVGRRGAFVRASSDGRRGIVRTFWNAEREADVLASCVEAYFDFDTPDSEEPERPDARPGRVGRVVDTERSRDDVLGRCLRFRYEKSWAEYYEQAAIAPEQQEAIWRHALGTIAMDVPMLLTFFLLLATRAGLPQQVRSRARLNRARGRSRKAPLLDHIEVCAPLLPEYCDRAPAGAPIRTRRGARLHHVRGHLVRRGNQVFWRVPHLRGSARWGSVRSRTIVWTFDADPSVHRAARRQLEQTPQLSRES